MLVSVGLKIIQRPCDDLNKLFCWVELIPWFGLPVLFGWYAHCVQFFLTDIGPYEITAKLGGCSKILNDVFGGISTIKFPGKLTNHFSCFGPSMPVVCIAML
jgi:hypothetical protein